MWVDVARDKEASEMEVVEVPLLVKWVGEENKKTASHDVPLLTR